jgi:hypothetical protein
MAEQLQGPFGKFMDWRQYRYYGSLRITAAHCRQSTNFSNSPHRMYLRERGLKGVDWTHLCQDRDQRRALVNTVMNLQVS